MRRQGIAVFYSSDISFQRLLEPSPRRPTCPRSGLKFVFREIAVAVPVHLIEKASHPLGHFVQADSPIPVGVEAGKIRHASAATARDRPIIGPCLDGPVMMLIPAPAISGSFG